MRVFIVTICMVWCSCGGDTTHKDDSGLAADSAADDSSVGDGSFGTCGRSTCGSVANPFAGTCADTLYDAFRCHAPSGTCTEMLTLEGFERRFSNGAAYEMNIPGGFLSGNPGTGALYGPGRELCASLRGTFLPTTTTIEYTIDGRAWTDVSINATNTHTITCPDQTTVNVSPSQLAALQACVGIGGG